MMNIAIRVDASTTIGTGHVMRCMTLADQFKKRNIDAFFICRNLEGNLISLIEKRGFKVYALDGNGKLDPHTIWQWYQVNWERDAKETISFLNRKINLINLLIVDHYGLGEKWETAVSQYVNQIMVIDDLANRKHRCNLLLDQNIVDDFARRYDDLIPNSCQKFLGPDYMLLREEFIHSKKRRRTGRITNILVSFGGSDPQNETLRVIHILASLNNDATVNVVVGQSSPFRNMIDHFCCKFKNFNYYCQVNNMAQLINKADISIGAGGTSMWERCFLGLPSIVIALAKNQIDVAKMAQKLGAVIYLGENGTISSKQIAEAIHLTFDRPDIVQNLSRHASNIFNEDKIKSLYAAEKIIGAIK